MIGLKYQWLPGGIGALALLLAGCSGDDYGGEAISGTSGAGDDGTSTTGPTTDATMDPTTDPPGTDTGTDTDTVPEDICPDLPDEVMCDQGGAQWPETLVSYEVTLDVRVNGEPYKGSVYDDADIYLVNADTGDRAHFGRVSGGILSGYVVEGRYRVSYEARDGAFSIPRNARAIVGGELSICAPYNNTIDITSLDAELHLRFDGEAPKATPYDDGVVTVSRSGESGRTVLGKTSQMADGKLNVKLLGGDYEFFYESEDRGEKMPYNSLALIGVKELPKDGGDDVVWKLVIDVPVVTLGASIDFDGVEPPQSPLDHGHIYLRDKKTDSVTEIADTMDGSIKPVPVIADGKYDLFYAAEMVGQAAPANHWGRLNTAMIMGSEAALSGSELADLTTLSLPTMTVEGEITVDGESKPVDPENRGELLAGSAEGDRGELGDVSAGIMSRLLKGDYDVFFRHDVSDGGLPANTFGRVDGESVKADNVEPLAVDVKSTALSGSITIGGAVPPLSVYDDGEVYLRNAAGDRVFLSRTRAGSYSRRIVEGTYDLYYAVVNTQGGVPANGETLLASGLVIGGEAMAYEIDVPVVTIGKGLLPKLPIENSGKARFFLRDVETKGEVFIGKDGESAEVLLIAEKKYELVYRMEALGLETPRNDGAVLACYE